LSPYLQPISCISRIEGYALASCGARIHTPRGDSLMTVNEPLIASHKL
jgi:hypothetical protein